ncbi:hypothetical protein [Nostoc sp. UIC 10630]|uniref:hypothetical protein n=1 Tax=Nostoc sp. UIC 10630 TaxID=2100146 RepID=UPI0013D1D454|nr:hypothetical protein [Nostoc sp. UIC 10630]NEU78036.1 hypothetical protein [Nostoc sp. UIC 10630]
MATINISDLHPAGSDLFSDSEGYMNDLGDNEFDSIYGGLLPALLFSVGKLVAQRSSAVCAKKAAQGIAVVSGAVSSWIASPDF